MSGVTKKRIIIVLLFGLCGAVIVSAFRGAEVYFQRLEAKRNADTSQLIEGALRSALLRYVALPELLAEKTSIKLVLANPELPDVVNKLNQQLKLLAVDIEASDIYVLDVDGLALAASNFDLERSFVGLNYNFRPYFTEAIKGKTSRFFALGTVSGRRGYYFSAPVINANRIVGVVVIKIEVDRFEDGWGNDQRDVIVADTNSVVFMASRNEWLFKSLDPLTGAALEQIRETRQYPLEKLGSLNAKLQSNPGQASSTLIVGRETFLVNLAYLPEVEWTLFTLLPVGEATRRAVNAVALVLMALLLSATVVGMVYFRWNADRNKAIAQAQARERLEQEVQSRTSALNLANRQLRQEVTEREEAEVRLRSTQAELVQAGKLAALGQMSAGLSHEMNQPLAAIKSYAANAAGYLNRKEIKPARENIARIEELADRMAEIGLNLRNFARKPQQAVRAVHLKPVLDAALQIMAGRLRSVAGHVVVDPFDEAITVRAGNVRLQQVFINLINNALDAMAGQGNPVVAIRIETGADRVAIVVSDTGGGIDGTILAKVFDPFFTTKGVNEGLGLGLSISYNIVQDFGGKLGARNRSGEGAEFVVELKPGDQESEGQS